MSLQVAETFREAFNDYDLSVIHHFKIEGETRVNKRQFVKVIRRNYDGSPPAPVNDTIRKITHLTDSEFNELMDSIRMD